ncbi:MAG: hypothetical protein U0103_06815 [Candidatus Obscuribacterales bacterium]
MNFKPIQKLGLLVPLLSMTTGLGSPALADATVQAFICDDRGSVSIQNGTSHDKKFVIPGINKVAVLVDAQANGPVGINYVFNPPIPFRNIIWYYKEAFGSDALRGITARYCVSLANGSQQQSFDIAGGVNNRGGNVGDGWSNVNQDTRTFPSIVTNGNAVISKLTFIFKDKNSQNNITLGRVSINENAVSPSQITETGPCNLKAPCVEQVPSAL